MSRTENDIREISNETPQKNKEGNKEENKREKPEIEWEEMNSSISGYCRQYAMEKTKKDITRNVCIACGCVALAIVMLIINRTFVPGIFETFLLAAALVTGIYGYNMAVKYQKTLERILNSGEAVYALAVFEDFQVNETSKQIMMIKSRDMETLCTLRFDNGAAETFKGVIEKAAIGERVLIIKRKNLKNLASKDCLKMRYPFGNAAKTDAITTDTEGID